MNDSNKRDEDENEPHAVPEIDDRIRDEGIPHNVDAPVYDPFTTPPSEELVEEVKATESEQPLDNNPMLHDPEVARPTPPKPAPTEKSGAPHEELATPSTSAKGSKKPVVVVPPPDEMDRLLLWARENTKIISAAILIVAFGFLALTLQRSGKSARLEVSSQLLNQAATVQALEGLIAEYSDTKAAELAKLRLGALHYSENNHAAAEAAFQRFIAEHPTHPLAADARIGLLRAKSALGQHADALAGFEAFCRDNPSHYLYGDAVMGRVRALKDLGRLDDARVIVEDFIAQHPDSSWNMLAQREIRMIERAARRAPAA